MDAVIDEGFAVAAARGVVPLVPTAAAYRELFYGRLVPSTAHHRSSMLQDLERGRPTEIEAINGCIWRFGREAGIPTPVNATMTRLDPLARAHRREPRARHDRRSNARRWRRCARTPSKGFPEEVCGVVFASPSGQVVRRMKNVQNALHAADPVANPRDARDGVLHRPRASSSR